MPSFGDSAFIFILALLLFGPKKLPELARQLGKLMAEFRRASNEFRIQMDEELRVADQAEQQKKIAAMEAAAPVTPPIHDATPDDVTPDDPEHPHLLPHEAGASEEEAGAETGTVAPLPIASEGDLALMPPATGLPTPRSSSTYAEAEATALDPILDTIPQTEDPATAPASAEPNGYYIPTPPDRHTHTAESTESTSEAPLHG
ncbi:MAG: sec-independent translocation protein [Acidobacteriaceae bacterium]|nr:sec-independent translocation protein [Acidobacteriaceae bacterium]